MPDKAFVLDGKTLTVCGSLQAGREDELRRHCDQLLARPEPELVIDLSRVDYIHSLSVGVLSYVWVEALSHDREVSFVVSKYVSDIFARTGLSRVFSCRSPGEA